MSNSVSLSLNTPDMQSLQTASHFQFSTVGLDNLTELQYTLATLVCDLSGSVTPFKTEIERCASTIVESLAKSPRVENLLFRVVGFNAQISEVHGFRLLREINPNEYNNTLNPSGNTALYDAILSSIEATNRLARMLVDQESEVNAVIYVLTDGMDNASSGTTLAIKNAINSAMKDECLQSIAVILIGIGYQDANVKTYLDRVNSEANLSQFVDLTELFTKASPATALAKIAGFVSKSFSTTSQVLQSGNSNASSSLLTI